MLNDRISLWKRLWRVCHTHVDFRTQREEDDGGNKCRGESTTLRVFQGPPAATAHATEPPPRREPPMNNEMMMSGLRMALLMGFALAQGCIYLGDGVDSEFDASFTDSNSDSNFDSGVGDAGPQADANDYDANMDTSIENDAGNDAGRQEPPNDTGPRESDAGRLDARVPMDSGPVFSDAGTDAGPRPDANDNDAGRDTGR